MRKILPVSLIVLAIATLIGFSTFRRPTNVTAQNTPSPVRKHRRHHDRGIPADFGSDVPGVQLITLGVLPDDEPGGADETALLRVLNNTNRGIDAYTVGGGDRINHRIEGHEVGWDNQGGFTLDPPEPLIPPYGQHDLRFSLGDLQDGWPLHLYAVRWHGGGYEGSTYGVNDLKGSLEQHLERHGHKSKGDTR
jgi:hypothetical protein